MSNALEKEPNTQGDVFTDVSYGNVDRPLERDDSLIVAKDVRERRSEMTSTGTYPADCYSFMSVHGPFDKTLFFYFGFVVWAFQIGFLMLLVLRVAHPTLSTNENDDNPDQDQASGFAFANFVPSNNNILSKATQYMALLSYCFFADASVRDIVTAVETFPNFARIKSGDRVDLIIFSCALRLFQGVLASIVVFVLVINTSDVIDIILNFTAVNFISDFDDVAFELCKWGKYGPRLKAEADRIEALPAPPCIYRKYQHVRYRYTITLILGALLSLLIVVTYTQHSLDVWLTTTLRIQFKDDPFREGFNGCYVYEARQKKRVLFKSFEANVEQARIGYCLDNNRWYLFTGNKTSACDTSEAEQLAFSSKTYSFDISTVFEDTWYSPTGTPLELYFFDDQKVELSDEICSAFIGDGNCDLDFNIVDHNYDNGDCCGTTCDSLSCGMGNTLTEVFNDINGTGNGYHNCIDPEMRPITIKIDNIFYPNETPKRKVSVKGKNPFADLDTIEPFMTIDCDGKNVLMVNVKESMVLQTETLWIPDDASCLIYVTNTTAGMRKIPFVNYTVYHGDEKSIDTNPIVITEADSSVNGMHIFQRIPVCFFAKLRDHVNISTMYTGDEPSNKAIRWLLNDSLGFSKCEYDTFIERYALTTMNYAAPIVKEANGSEGNTTAEFWFTPGRQCEWLPVGCFDGRVVEVDLDALSLAGTIATEIGLLENLNWLNFRNNHLHGSIPSQIGELQSLVTLAVEFNSLSGTIPTEIGNIRSLTSFVLLHNKVTGTVPSEIGKLSSLKMIALSGNMFSGTIPHDVTGLPSMEVFYFDHNSLTGTIPTMLATSSNLRRVNLENNSLTGKIPTELGLLTELTFLRVGYNELTGSIPTDLLEARFDPFEYYGNKFSDLVPIDDELICSAAGGGDVYCNCESDCTFARERCVCEEARSCCSEYIGNHTQCNVCPFGVENPDTILFDLLMACSDMEDYIQNDVLRFGDEKTCETVAKRLFREVGCRCRDQRDNGEGAGPDNGMQGNSTTQPQTENPAALDPGVMTDDSLGS